MPGIVGLTFIVMFLWAMTPVAQVVGGVSGSVTDESKSVMPGVKISVATNGLQRSSITDAEGRFLFTDLPVGMYTAMAELVGFETALRENILVTSERTAKVAFVLKIGCTNEVQWMDMGLISTLQSADAILQIRISESNPAGRCPLTGFCVCTEHTALVKRIVKAPLREMSLHSIRFLQEGAGRIEHGPGGVEQPYVSGDEFIAFLRWDATANLFRRIGGPGYMFPILFGRVQFLNPANGLTDGMTVEDFAGALRALIR